MFHFRTISLLLLFGITLGSYAPYYDPADAEQYFADFINKYEKKYESLEEFRRRFDIFKRNLNKINEWNAEHQHENGGYMITKFSDQDGHHSCIDLREMSNDSIHEVNREFILNAPDAIDYRDQNLVTEVKVQGNCGSCYIFSAIGNIESMHAKKSGELVSLSEQQVLDCNAEFTCHGGYSVAVMNAMASQGCMSEQDYPYKAEKETCNADESNIKVRVKGGHVIKAQDVETLKGALIENGAPLSVGFYASPQFKHYSGTDVLRPTDCDVPIENKTKNGFHAILLVGYNADPSSGKRPHWIIKNSWGTGHGDQGYFYLDFENHCNFGRHVATSTVA